MILYMFHGFLNTKMISSIGTLPDFPGGSDGKASAYYVGDPGSNCLLLPCLFSLYAERIMQNDRLDKLQTGIKIAKRNQQPQIYG